MSLAHTYLKVHHHDDSKLLVQAYLQLLVHSHDDNKLLLVIISIHTVYLIEY